MTFTENIIQRYKSIRTRRQLGDVCRKRYAFVGIGSHSIANLYPVLAHLRVPVKYICCRSTTKAAVAAEKFSGIKVTTSLDEILEDNEIAGVFVSASPSAHFDIAAKILGSGKSLFIEKPPCSSAEELGRLKDMIILHGTPTAMAGMQKRYAPATQILKSRLRHQRPISYNMKYLTGSYPEGDMLSDLFIHPLDYVTFLFGRAEITGIDSVSHSHGAKTMMLLLRHGDTAGTLELSTAYTDGSIGNNDDKHPPRCLPDTEHGRTEIHTQAGNTFRHPSGQGLRPSSYIDMPAVEKQFHSDNNKQPDIHTGILQRVESIL